VISARVRGLALLVLVFAVGGIAGFFARPIAENDGRADEPDGATRVCATPRR
jgi:hypothetical protein